MKTQGVFRRGIILGKVNIVEPTIMYFITFIVFDKPMGKVFIMVPHRHVVTVITCGFC